ncbi:myo-inositol-1(or 4)-monophosphatase [Nocardioides sp. BE266]|uniref:inositol monophosphatase family protein n=1 Tax=Nocardioides sp. BE266 TaxID=2817725 RepID=UPI00285E0AB2|nr:inositol monophosphatase family protein [Nocardioides sp. BE266]MDR7255427.1 myo-inositol-1(or 4)-monophosphatase [Nocardioides sp. BE266]
MSDTDLDVAVRAARAGAAVLQRMYGSELTRQAKSATDFATAADVEAEQAILDVIRAARPDDAFVGEELGEVSGARDRTWLVDPLCGTLNFAAFTPLFSVNVALVVGGSTSVAAVAHPPSGEVYWADDGAFGVLGREHAAPANRLVNINADGPLDRPFVGAQLAADPDFRATFAPRVESTTLALAWVAAGRRLAYVTDGRLEGSLHFTPGIALCEAAPGVVVSDFDGAPVHTGPGLVAAADAETHATLLQLVARHRP